MTLPRADSMIRAGSLRLRALRPEKNEQRVHFQITQDRVRCGDVDQTSDCPAGVAQLPLVTRQCRRSMNVWSSAGHFRPGRTTIVNDESSFTSAGSTGRLRVLKNSGETKLGKNPVWLAHVVNPISSVGCLAVTHEDRKPNPKGRPAPRSGVVEFEIVFQTIVKAHPNRVGGFDREGINRFLSPGRERTRRRRRVGLP